MHAIRQRSPRAALLAVAALLAAVAALAVVTPPAPADAQVVPEGRVLTTATWTWGSGGPPTGPGEECTTSACQRYQDVIDNFFQNGATNAFTTIEIEDITDRNGNIIGNKVTVRCDPDYDCSWNGRDVRDEDGNETGAFTDERKAVNLNEREEYEDPSEQDVARQRSPVGSVGPQPRGRTATWEQEGIPHCGERNSDEGEYRYYVVDDPDNPRRCVLYDPEENHRNENGWTYTDPDTGLNVRVKDVLPATMPLQYQCQGNHLHGTNDGDFTLRGGKCIWTVPEYASPQEAQQRAPTLTTPGTPPVYEPPTQREIDNCNRRSDHESCLRNLEIQAANEYDRAAEQYDAAWQRYQQELDNLADDPATDEDETQQYWACIHYDEWQALIEDGVNTARCFLVN